MSLADRLKNLDSHSSVSKEFRVYTIHGAVLSIVTLIFIIYLTTAEFFYNFRVSRKDRVHVNATTPDGLEVEFDLSLYHVPCSQLKVDALDPNGEPQSLHIDDKEHNVWKHRFVLNGRGQRVLVGQKTKLELGSTLIDDKVLLNEMEALSINQTLDQTTNETLDDCGDCYGAGDEGECCNTCEEVKAAYRRKGWQLTDLTAVKQCRLERRVGDEGEGCNIHGRIALSTGGGDWHMAPGKDPSANDFTILDMLLQTFQRWNVSHTIHKMRFGPEYPAAVYQLDGETRTITDVYGMYQYYFKVRDFVAVDIDVGMDVIGCGCGCDLI
jgi:endoplasmic reticulum-Golgi intermediate compartment protein 3